MSAPGWASSTERASSAQRKSPSTNSPSPSMKKQRSASPSQAIPRSAPSLSTRSITKRRFSGSSGFGSWSGNSPSGSQQYGISSSAAQRLEDRSDHRPRHPVAAVEHDPQRPDRGRVDERERAAPELRADVDLLAAPRLAVRLAHARDDERADVADAGVARQRERALAHELGPGVRLRVVRRRAHEPAVEPARADEEVEHLRPDHPGVEHVGALGQHPVAVARGQLRRAQPHVAAEPDPQRARRLAAQPREDARERAPDPLGQVAVDLLAVEAADVVGLEDVGRDGRRHGGRG